MDDRNPAKIKKISGRLAGKNIVWKQWTETLKDHLVLIHRETTTFPNQFFHTHSKESERQRAVLEEHAQNPPVSMRLNLVNQLLEKNRLFIDPKAERTAKAFRRCEAKNKKPVGKYSHAPNAALYFIWRAENALLEAIVESSNCPVEF